MADEVWPEVVWFEQDGKRHTLPRLAPVPGWPDPRYRLTCPTCGVVSVLRHEPARRHTLAVAANGALTVHPGVACTKVGSEWVKSTACTWYAYIVEGVAAQASI